jgi:glycosidase
MAAYGAHHTMGNISGNHDQVRIASLAGGAIRADEDGKEAGWTRTVGIGDANVAYRKAMLQEVINFTIPGVPCIYQGDEYGEVGANDPDNRLMMRFDRLNEQEQQMRSEVQKLIRLRRTSMPLLYGDMQTENLTEDEWTYTRTYMGKKVRVTINRKDLTYTIES